MKFLHLLWKFHGYIFHGLGENKFENWHLEILPVDLKSGFLKGHFMSVIPGGLQTGLSCKYNFFIVVESLTPFLAGPNSIYYLIVINIKK